MRGLRNAPKICVYGKNYVDNINFIPKSFAAISFILNFFIKTPTCIGRPKIETEKYMYRTQSM